MVPSRVREGDVRLVRKGQVRLVLLVIWNNIILKYCHNAKKCSQGPLKYTSALFPIFSRQEKYKHKLPVDKSCSKLFRTKRVLVKCWWNWHLLWKHQPSETKKIWKLENFCLLKKECLTFSKFSVNFASIRPFKLYATMVVYKVTQKIVTCGREAEKFQNCFKYFFNHKFWASKQIFYI